MAYSSYYVKKGHKTLIFLGALSLCSLLIGGLVLFRQLGRQNGWQKTKGIEKLSVANISAHGFEVIWSTKTPVTEDQWIEWGTKKNEFTAKQSAEHMNGIYFVDIKGLTADTLYFYRVRKGSQTYELNSLAQTEIRTPKGVKEQPVSPAYGKVILPSGKPYANGLVLYEMDGYYPLAVFTKETGEWLIPLTGIINKKTNKIQSIADSTPVSLKLFSYPDGNVRTTVGQTHPLRQAITAGKSVRLAQIPLPGSVLGEKTQSNHSPTQIQPQIIYPKENGLIPGNTPLIRGVAVALKDVLVLIQGPTKQYSYRTKSDEKGDWLIQYPISLEAGRYTISASTVDISGFPLTLRRTFSIIKSGEQVLGTATGSPTLAPTSPIVPTYANPTVVPTLIAMAPTSVVYPTGITPTLFIPTATPPITGGGISTYLFSAIFCIVIGTGLVLAF
jgi:hypothetical protein